MSRLYSHVNTAKAILTLYKGEVPFRSFLKSFFAKEKKYGSRDRKTISSLCYNYFRLGYAIKKLSVDEGLLISYFLLNDSSTEWLQLEKPEWNEKITLALEDKFHVAHINAGNIFPFNHELSEGIDLHHFNISFLIQPDLFIRVRPGKPAGIKKKLTEAQIPFTEISSTCLAFANGTKLEGVLEINNEAVIQDLNSQRVGELLADLQMNNPVKIWDCCAASGGKSIMVSDLLSNVQLTVSDVRQSIIQNLHKRFAEAGITGYKAFVADLTSSQSIESFLHNSEFDVIICDAPCSGSGTWSRTPEQLSIFKPEEIIRYSDLQKRIVSNAVPHVKSEGYFLYITCSVFKKENEAVVEFIQRKSNMKLIKMELLKGYGIKADTMFAALFKAI